MDDTNLGQFRLSDANIARVLLPLRVDSRANRLRISLFVFNRSIYNFSRISLQPVDKQLTLVYAVEQKSIES